MKTVGYLLIAAGFLAGAYFAVLDADVVPWMAFLPALGTGVAGVVLARLALRREAQAADTVAANVDSAAAALSRLAVSSRDLDLAKAGLDPYEVRHRIDEIFPADLDTFVQAREAIGHRFGLHAYADVMSHFATAERYLNRAWSASADGYIDEVKASLGRSREEFAAAQARLAALVASPTG